MSSAADKLKRRAFYADYKITRKPMPEELVGQLPLINEAIAAHGVRSGVQPGFEADDMLAAIAMLLKQVAEHRALVENEYTRAVNADGNPEALAVMAEVFSPCDAEWRGLWRAPSRAKRSWSKFATPWTSSTKASGHCWKASRRAKQRRRSWRPPWKCSSHAAPGLA